LKRVKRKLVTMLLVVAALVVVTLSAVTTTARPALAANGPGTRWPIDGYAPNEGTDNFILKWDERLLESIRDNPRATGPTVTARAIGVLHTATYDAWAAYDPVAVDTRQRLRDPDLDLRRPAAEGTGPAGLANKNKAISYAAYQVLVDLFPGRASAFSDYMLNTLGFDPNDPDTSNLATPEGIGTSAADAVLAYRHADNSNQQDSTDPNTGKPVVIYPDTTSYSSDNSWHTVPYPWQWQPLCVLTAQGVQSGAPPTPPTDNPDNCSAPNYTIQSPLTPHWGLIKSFALNDETHYPLQFQLPGPPKLANGTCCDPTDVDKALSQTSNLTDTQKVKADYWADGPKTEFPPGHMAVFAQALSRMRKGTLDQQAWLDRDVKLFFALGNALMDASISSWHSKYQYDFVRPTTAIRERYKNKMVTSWLGPGNGYGKVPGQNWRPYQEPTVLTPPFPEYVSGHSTFSGAGAVVIASAFGNNAAFNAKVTIPAGDSKIEPGVTPAKPVVLYWKTLDAASDEAGWSRRWGGIHFETGDMHGRGLGKTIGYNVWQKAQLYFSGDSRATAT
jgi:hypothetical protein